MRSPGWGLRRERAQSLVELAALMLPTLVLVVGLVALGHLLDARAGVDAVAYEAARVASQANTSSDAETAAQRRAADLAATYGLTNGSLVLSLDTGGAGALKRGQPVVATVTYQVQFGDIRLLGWAAREVRGSHTERVEQFRSIVIVK